MRDAGEIRKAMGPELCELADVLRDQFGAKLVYLQTPTMNIGRDPAAGSVSASGKPDQETKQMQYWYGRRA